MAVLNELEPVSVFRYFEEICAIPHGSRNTKQISDYCARFAREHDLRCIQDASNNIIIFKDGTPGYEQSAPVMLQGHLDMVCEKTADCIIDFQTDGLSLHVDDGFISAEETTLGGDDGIAVAYALAILAANDIPHPPLEVVFTVDEEIGMLGATMLDCTPLRARTMLNLDSEEEGYLLVSCAGGICATCHIPIVRKDVEGVHVTLTISDLTGGHSGVEIDKGRANANQLLGRALNELRKTVSYSLISVSGGLKDNAIPREAAAELVAAPDATDAIQAFAAKYQEIFRAEYHATEPSLSLAVISGEVGKFSVMNNNAQIHVIAALLNLPGGIQRMSADIPGLVQTSLNLGILATTEDDVSMSFSVRSSVGTEKEALISQLSNLMDILGGSVVYTGDYPAWEYNPDSKLRDLMVEIFEEQYGRRPIVQALHAGVECGLFAGKLPGLDCVSFGPNIMDIHTTSERMDIASVQRTWKFTLEILKRLK